MTNNNLKLKKIKDLTDYKFYIPAYQRGYRWGEKQVTDLLDDIDKFEQTGENDWYCLQPIVVKQKEDKYELIDGQQRLTTIFLIQQHLNEKSNEKLFELEYETREGSSEDKSRNNIDYNYIFKAYKTIKNWFEAKDLDHQNQFKDKLNDHSKVIWYETKEEDVIAIFTRLNIGKIPLTNAELIKALFLNSSNFKLEDQDKIRLTQLEIARQWDIMEIALQDDKFWYFLTQTEKETNRIEFILKTIMSKDTDAKDEYALFRFFNEKFEKEEDIKDIWKEIKQHYQRFCEWFEDRTLYHKIGYLINCNISTVKELYEKSKDKNKDTFQTDLDEKIKGDLCLTEGKLNDLSYGDKDKLTIKKLLLLYNVITMLKNKNATSLFPFDVYKKGKWDIEHIIPQTDSPPSDFKDQKKWLEDIKLHIDKTELKKDEVDLKKKVEEALEKAKATPNNNDFSTNFTSIYEEVNEYFDIIGKDKITEKDSIFNLTLLNSSINRSYKNAVFPVKRKKIIERDKEGNFIPVCTKNIFLKYYSDNTPKISFWSEEDMNNYEKDLKETLKKYLTGE